MIPTLRIPFLLLENMFLFGFVFKALLTNFFFPVLVVGLVTLKGLLAMGGMITSGLLMPILLELHSFVCL